MFLTLSLSSVFGQKTITYDFKNQTLKGNDVTFNEKDKIRILIQNINLYLYKVTVNTQKEKFNSKAPKLITDILGSEASSLFPKIFTLNVDNLRVGDKVTDTSLPILNTAILNKKSLISIAQSYQKLLSIHQSYLYNVLKTQDAQCLDCANDNHKDFNTIYNTLQNNLLEIENFKFLLDGVDETTLSAPEKQVLTTLKGIDLDVLREEFKNAAILNLNMSNDNFNFKSPSFSAESDEMTFKISISPRLTTDKPEIPLRTDSVTIKIPIIRKGFQISFSTGLFMSQNKNESYNYKAILKKNSFSEVDYYSLTADKDNKHIIGVNSLAHAMIDVSKNLSLGVHLGIGVPIEKKANLYGFCGISGAFGKKERIIANIGRSGGLVNQLSSNVNLTQQFKNTETAISYARLFSGSWSASLTFNFYNK